MFDAKAACSLQKKHIVKIQQQDKDWATQKLPQVLLEIQHHIQLHPLSDLFLCDCCTTEERRKILQSLLCELNFSVKNVSDYTYTKYDFYIMWSDCFSKRS